MKWLITLLSRLLKWDTVPIPANPMESELTPVTTAQTAASKLYIAAKDSLGKHMTLNEAVSAEVGCAEAISAVLKLAGYEVPKLGIPGTADLADWLSSNPHFELINIPEKAAIVVSSTGTGNGLIRGHTGILGGFGIAFQNDYGIMSNNSDSGLFLELWNVNKWDRYYRQYGGLKTQYFRAI